MDSTPRAYRAALLAAALALTLPRFLRAEDALTYKYEDYREADGRMAVQTQSAQLTQDFGTDTELKLTGTNDAIAGATPTGVPAQGDGQYVPVTNIHDHRKAWTVDLTRQFPGFNLDPGFAYSREHDYTSWAYSLNTVIDFNQKNTELTLGASANEDYVKVYILGPPWRNKHGGNAIVGVSQVLGPNTLATFDVTWGRETGFLSDQYKIVEKRIELIPGLFQSEAFAENRPNSKDHGTALLGLNQALPGLRAAIDLSYRFYADTNGIQAHTVELSWIQQVTDFLSVEPNVRFYRQTAANFYYYNLDITTIIPVRVPNGNGPFYSSDYRLSAEQTYTFGGKLVWKVKPWLQLDVAFDKYSMRGTDGMTPQSAYPMAKITTGGVKVSW